MKTLLCSASALVLLLALFLVACGESDPLAREKRDSGEQMQGLWYAVKVYHNNVGERPEGVADVIKFLSTSEEMRIAYPDKQFDVSPMAAVTGGVSRPHYRLLTTDPQVSDSTKVVVESPALYGDEGTQVIDADGNVHWVEAAQAQELWQQGL